MYPCSICGKPCLNQHALITHWGIMHNNLPEERRLKALEEARRHHLEATDETESPQSVRHLARGTT